MGDDVHGRKNLSPAQLAAPIYNGIREFLYEYGIFYDGDGRSMMVMGDGEGGR